MKDFVTESPGRVGGGIWEGVVEVDYLGGTYFSSNGGPWSRADSEDLHFRTYVEIDEGNNAPFKPATPIYTTAPHEPGLPNSPFAHQAPTSPTSPT